MWYGGGPCNPALNHQVFLVSNHARDYQLAGPTERARGPSHCKKISCTSAQVYIHTYIYAF